MAQARTISFSKLLVLVGDGGGPEQFDAPCGLTTRGIAFTANANDVIVPDCDDEDAPAWVERAIESLSAGITGSGVLDKDALAVWRTWFLSGLARNVQIKHDDTLANGGGQFEGSFILTQFNVTAERGQKVTIEVEMASDGAVTWVPAAA